MEGEAATDESRNNLASEPARCLCGCNWENISVHFRLLGSGGGLSFGEREFALLGT